MNVLTTILVCAELLLFVATAFSVLYVAVFALASRLPSRSASRLADRPSVGDGNPRPCFLIIIPAYAEDSVIVPTAEAALNQKTRTLPRHDVCVVSDHMSAETNKLLRQMPLRLVMATYADSTKGKALQAAMAEAYDPERHTHVLILDADNIIAPDLLCRLAPLCTPSRKAIQLHRCAKNTETAVAVLDAVSEEINNSIFRRGHNRLGLSSALIGSGICFDAAWLAIAVQHLQSAGEDKELERQLLLDGCHILYADDLLVLDEKVSNRDNFSRQRRRWLAAQFWALGFMLKGLPRVFTAHKSRRIDYLDKTLQQALIPRSLLVAIVGMMTFATVAFAVVTSAHAARALRWSVLAVVLCLSLYIAIPRHLRGRRLMHAAATLPQLVWQMALSLFHLRGASHKFIHTQHGTQ